MGEMFKGEGGLGKVSSKSQQDPDVENRGTMKKVSSIYKPDYLISMQPHRPAGAKAADARLNVQIASLLLQILWMLSVSGSHSISRPWL